MANKTETQITPIAEIKCDRCPGTIGERGVRITTFSSEDFPNGTSCVTQTCEYICRDCAEKLESK